MIEVCQEFMGYPPFSVSPSGSSTPEGTPTDTQFQDEASQASLERIQEGCSGTLEMIEMAERDLRLFVDDELDEVRLQDLDRGNPAARRII